VRRFEMTTEQEARDLKRAMGQRGRGRPIPTAVRADAVAYAQRRRHEGASQEAIASELGISQHTVSSWLRRAAREKTSALVPVRVAHAATRVSGATIVLTTPQGLRVEGLGVDDVCTVISRIG
jgi:transposase-like protein